MAEVTLIYVPSDEIIRFVTANPIDWCDRDNAKRGGVGDKAGMTPTPAVEEFLNLLIARRGLFTQKEYMEWCWDKWREWILLKPYEQKVGIKAKLYRNFYPAMIDSIHVWAMLCESGMFDRCILNSAEDAIGKTDLIVFSRELEYRLALIGPTEYAKGDRQYKLQHRGNSDNRTCIEIVLPMTYPKTPGNKRWYNRGDVMQSILSVNREYWMASEATA